MQILTEKTFHTNFITRRIDFERWRKIHTRYQIEIWIFFWFWNDIIVEKWSFPIHQMVALVIDTPRFQFSLQSIQTKYVWFWHNDMVFRICLHNHYSYHFTFLARIHFWWINCLNVICELVKAVAQKFKLFFYWWCDAQPDGVKSKSTMICRWTLQWCSCVCACNMRCTVYTELNARIRPHCFNGIQWIIANLHLSRSIEHLVTIGIGSFTSAR